jgi:hypothetical protein
MRGRGVVLNPGRAPLEAGQTAVVVGASQAAVDAGLQQRFAWPARPPAPLATLAPLQVQGVPARAACADGAALPERPGTRMACLHACWQRLARIGARA